MGPDPGSRTGDLDGRRLELIDPARGWGWRVINHGIYRERARKKAYDQARTESGADAERKRASRDVPRSPPVSRSQTHTQNQTQTPNQRTLKTLSETAEETMPGFGKLVDHFTS
jgi:hypothetical protein